MRTRTARLGLSTAVLVAAGLALTACNPNDGGSAAGASSSSSAPTTPSGSTAGNASTAAGGTQTDNPSSSGTSTGAGTGSNKNSGVGRCRTDELKITAQDNTIDGDPDRTVVVELKNSGGRDCMISGYAGVDLKTNAGTLSAKRVSQETATPAILKSGKSTYFPIEYPSNTSGGSGVRITALVVTPPAETKSVTLNWPGAATLPVTDNPSSTVKVGPVGRAGQGG
jgi:hypothetical protein